MCTPTFSREKAAQRSGRELGRRLLGPVPEDFLEHEKLRVLGTGHWVLSTGYWVPRLMREGRNFVFCGFARLDFCVWGF